MAYGLYLVVGFLPFAREMHIGPIATLTILGGLEFLFDRWGWRILCRIPSLNVHSFNGTYAGTLHAGDGRQHDAELTVKQTWSKIEIDFKSGKATSKSYSASIVEDRLASGQVELVYNYYAHGVHDGGARMGAHYGTTRLKLLAKGKELEGDYYTEQARDTAGRVFLSST